MRPRTTLSCGLALAAMIASQPARAAAPAVFAITGARIVIAPGSSIESGTVIVRDGIIEAVGADLTAPTDARVLERDGLTVYPGLIDAYVEQAWPEAGDSDVRQGAHDNPLVRPERGMALHGITAATAKKLRAGGFATVTVAPEDGLFRGRSAIINLGEGGVDQNLVRATHAHNVTFATNPRGGGYPGSLMGSVALFRQTLLDARWHESAWTAYEANPAQKRPPMNAALAALAPVAKGDELVVIESDDALDTLRSSGLIQEFGLRAHIVGSGDEYRRLDEITALDLTLIVPVDFPDVPDVPDEDDLALDLDELRHWDQAPLNPKALLDAGNTVAFTSHGLDSPREVLTKVQIAIDRGGLSSDEALTALTVTPARLLGIEDRAGTVEAGKMANLVLVEGDLFSEKPEIREVWVDGRRFEIEDSEPPEIEPSGTWELTVTTGDGETVSAVMVLEGDASDLSGTISDPAGNRVSLSRVEVSGSRLDVVFDGTGYGTPGDIEFSMDVEGNTGSGTGASPAGRFTITATRSQEPEEIR